VRHVHVLRLVMQKSSQGNRCVQTCKAGTLGEEATQIKSVAQQGSQLLGHTLQCT
jgi:hypothetical protein